MVTHAVRTTGHSAMRMGHAGGHETRGAYVFVEERK